MVTKTSPIYGVVTIGRKSNYQKTNGQNSVYQMKICQKIQEACRFFGCYQIPRGVMNRKLSLSIIKHANAPTIYP